MSTPVFPPIVAPLSPMPRLPEPKVVYHYTSLAAMMNILKTQKIRATDIAYLNDVSERNLLLDIVDQQIVNFAAVRNIDGTPFRIATGSRLLDGPYVSSFSSEGDSLNQWRSYCPVANGVSIGFRTECLKSAKLLWTSPFEGAKRNMFSFDTGCHFKAVTYVKPNHLFAGAKVLEEAHADAVKNVEEMEENYPDQSFSVDDYFRQNVEVEASFYKHQGFANESEYRLVLSSTFFNTHQVEFRCTRSSLVPYVSLTIPHSSSADLIRPAVTETETPEVYKWDAVAELIIGPTPNIELTRDAVWRFCQSIGLMSAQLTESKLPYRDW